MNDTYIKMHPPIIEVTRCHMAKLINVSDLMIVFIIIIITGCTFTFMLINCY